MNPIVDPAIAWGLPCFLAFVLVQRVAELRHSASNARWLLRYGAREHGGAHFPLLVAIHVLFPVCLAGEVLLVGTHPGPLWPLWLAVWCAAQVLRFSAMHALGRHWTVRILVIPGMPLVRRGPYRTMRHPNYLAVVTELLAGPLIFGAWRTAVAISLLNLVALAIRVWVEDSALGRGAPLRGQREP